MDKLFVLRSIYDNKVIAITEYKSHMRIFILQNEYSKNEYSLKEYTNKNKINKYLIKYTDDYYLIEYKDFIIRNSDKKYIEEIIYKYKHYVRDTINNLESINTNCILSPEDHKKIGDIINTLYDNTRKKNIDKFINVHQIIKDFCNDHESKYNLQDMNDRYRYNLSKEN